VQAKLDTVSKAQASANAELARETRVLAAQLERQQRNEASNRDDLTRLRAHLAQALQTQSALDAEFNRQRAAVALQLDTLRQDRGRDRDALGHVGQRLADMTQAQGPLRTALERQRADLRAEIGRLQQEAAGSRAEVARLRTEMAAIVQAQSPLLALREEMLANRAGLRHLEGEFDAIKRASSGGKPLQTELNTSSIAPMPPSPRTPQSSPGSRSLGLAALPARVPSRVVPRLAQKNAARAAVAALQRRPPPRVAPRLARKNAARWTAAALQRNPREQGDLDPANATDDAIKRTRSRKKGLDGEVTTPSVALGAAGTRTMRASLGPRPRVAATPPVDVDLPDGEAPRAVLRACLRQPCRW
jgi:hypothetical protein